MEKLEILKHWICESKNIVFFGGAGVSTESGIPDFRSVDGLYNQKFDYPPETIISANRSIFSGSSGRRCCLWALSRMLPTRCWQNGKKREDSLLL